LIDGIVRARVRVPRLFAAQSPPSQSCACAFACTAALPGAPFSLCFLLRGACLASLRVGDAPGLLRQLLKALDTLCRLLDSTEFYPNAAGKAKGKGLFACAAESTWQLDPATRFLQLLRLVAAWMYALADKQFGALLAGVPAVAQPSPYVMRAWEGDADPHIGVDRQFAPHVLATQLTLALGRCAQKV
jgi:hypothetical protein